MAPELLELSPMLPTTADDLIGLRQELSMSDRVDVRSALFLRFIIRLSERFDLDIPTEDYPLLATVPGCSRYLGLRARPPSAGRSALVAALVVVR